MDRLSCEILETFDRLGLSRLSAADFPAAAAAQPLASGSLATAIASLLETGCLLQVGGQFERTEFGRLQIAPPTRLTCLSRPGCHLCEEALRVIEPLAHAFGALLHTVDVDSDRTLRARYGNDIPVLFLGSRELARHRFDPHDLRRELEHSARRR